MPVGHYPSDPTGALFDIQQYFLGGQDVKFLVHGVYDLVGFILNLTVGDPTAIMIDPAIVTDSVLKVNAAMSAPPTVGAAAIEIPPWAKPILQMGLQALMAWLQGQLTIQHSAKP